MLQDFELSLLDGFAFRVTGEILDIPGQKSRALMCVLAMNPGKTVARTYLGELLWDGMGPEQAAVNLRQTLSVIKRALGPHYESVLHVTKLTLALNHTAVAIDALQSDKVDQVAPDHVSLFNGLSAKSRSFETWLSDQNAALTKASIQRTQLGLSKALETGKLHEALPLAQRLHQFEPDNETYSGQVYRLLRAVGQNYEASVFAKDFPIADIPAETLAPAPTDESRAAPIILIGRFSFREQDKAAGHIAISLSEAVVGDLSESAWVRVIAPDLTHLSAPMFGLVHQQATPMRWNYRLDGTIQSDPLAASIWLTDGTDQTIVWTEKFRADRLGLLADDIVSRVTSSLESIVLDAEGKRATHARTLSGYWENIAKARMLFWRSSQSANQEAELLLDQMLDDTPHDVRVLTLAAYAKLMNAWSGWQGSTAINLEQATRFSRRAIQSVPDDAWSLMTHATVLSARLDLVGAKRKLDQAIAIRPHLSAAKGELARVLVFAGETKKGHLLAAEALDASPKDPHASLWLRSQAFARWMEGDYDAAIEMSELAIEKRPNWYPNYLLAAVAYVRANNLTQAQEAIQQANALGISHITTEALRCGHPFDDRQMFDRFLVDLQTAGWQRSEVRTVTSV